MLISSFNSIVMKLFTSGLVALITTAFIYSFESVHRFKNEKIFSESGKDNLFDICPESSKLYYKLNLPCSQQRPLGNLDVAVLVNPNNYSLFGPFGTFPPDEEQCFGSLCICVIKACPDPSTGNTKPLLPHSSDIYYQLLTYSVSEIPYNSMIEKNQ